MKVNGIPYKTIWFENNKVNIIFQPAIPHSFEIRVLNNHEEIAQAIEKMWVRGAPAIGVAGAFGMLQGLLEANSKNYREYCVRVSERLKSTRPTAQNLFVGIDLVHEEIIKSSSWENACKNAEETARKIMDLSVLACERIGEIGSEIIKNGYSILTHCNAGWLACVDWGTALAPIYKSFRQGKDIFVFVDETRPRAQGANLTAWELGEEGVDHAVIADNAAGYFLYQNKINCVIVGADRIASNGDVANKIGTYTKAVVASECNTPFYVAAPISTIDFSCTNGGNIPIEERSPDEVHYTWGRDDNGNLTKVRTTPRKSKARNPAFDVTPAKYITGIITEKGIYTPDELSKLNIEE